MVCGCVVSGWEVTVDQARSGTTEIQLDRADFGPAAATGASCSFCKCALANEYWDVNGQVSCEPCKGHIEGMLTGRTTMGQFAKALLFGLVGGVLGSLVWFAVAKFLSLELGLIAILIGYLVAKGVRLAVGFRGRVGYQVLAVVLTYLSIGFAYFLLIVSENSSGLATAFADPLRGLLGMAAVYAIALAIPVLAGFKNIMGLIIIGIALYEAWVLTRPVAAKIGGPYQIGSASAAVAGSEVGPRVVGVESRLQE